MNEGERNFREKSEFVSLENYVALHELNFVGFFQNKI